MTSRNRRMWQLWGTGTLIRRCCWVVLCVALSLPAVLDAPQVEAAGAGAEMISPAPGSTLGRTVAFSWTDVSEARQYFLYVGRERGANDIFGKSAGTALSMTVEGLPSTGGKVYVRLWSELADSWVFTDYTYSATGAGQWWNVRPGNFQERIDVPGGWDSFKLDVKPGARYTVSTTLGSLEDSVLAIFNSVTQSSIVENDDYGGRLASQVSWTADSSITVWIVVRAYGDDQTGTYSLAILEDTGQESAVNSRESANANGDCWERFSSAAYVFRSWLCVEDDYEEVRVEAHRQCQYGDCLVVSRRSGSRYLLEIINGSCYIPLGRRVTMYSPNGFGNAATIQSGYGCRIRSAEIYRGN